MEASVGCGESANRIERTCVVTDAVPIGHRILQTFQDRKYCLTTKGTKVTKK
jgi:hypothetical protein